MAEPATALEGAAFVWVAVCLVGYMVQFRALFGPILSLLGLAP